MSSSRNARHIFAASLAAFAVPAVIAAAPGVDSSDPLASVDRNRTAIISDIVDGFRGDITQGFPDRTSEASADLKARLAKLRADRLLAASIVTSFTSLKAILDESESRTHAASSGAMAKAMGDANRDLLYTPLTPCRLVDTRGFGAPFQGGAFLPNSRRNFAPQGQCAIPTSGVASMIISFTTQNLTPSSGGFLAILAPAAPVTASVDIFNLGSEWSASNTAVATGSAGQFDVLVSTATAHVVIDILGYFSPSTAIPTPATTVAAATTKGLVPVVGGSTEYARADHSHGTPPAPVAAEARWTLAWRVSSGVMHAIAVRNDGSLRSQTDPTTVLTKVGTGQYCIQAVDAAESAVASIQSGAPGTTIQASMAQGSFCNSVSGSNITVQIFGP